MRKVAELFLVGLREGDLYTISPKSLNEKSQESIIRILNESWNLFWNNPEGFGFGE